MRLDDRQWAGLFLFLGGVQFSIFLIVAEAVDPPYSVSSNYISDLGVRAGAPFFNASIAVFGIMAVIGAWFAFRAFKDRIFLIVVVFAGVGIIGVGVFTEDFPPLHAIFSFIAFVFAALSAVVAYRILRPPLSYVSVLLGLGSIVALILFVSHEYLKLGVGGMERMIVYPVLTWTLGFGGYLLGIGAQRPHPPDAP